MTWQQEPDEWGVVPTLGGPQECPRPEQGPGRGEQGPYAEYPGYGEYGQVAEHGQDGRYFAQPYSGTPDAQGALQDPYAWAEGTQPDFPAAQFMESGRGWDLDSELTLLLRQHSAQEAQQAQEAQEVHREEPEGFSTAPPAAGSSSAVTHGAGVPPYGRGTVLPRRRRRRARHTVRQLLWPSLTFGIVAVSMGIFGAVSVVSGLITYTPLKAMATPSVGYLAAWWPFLIYGPWTAASLFILRGPARCGKRPRIAWAALLAFSLIAGALCVVRADNDLASIAVAALPPVAALSCLQLLIIHLAPSRPRHAVLPQRPQPVPS
ncbi:hypothetical protein [Streptomyces sp. HNM0574]|uniref:hypothetical protein n=1 Tax=Streptomyces sp. HNM0574 TaxID=2714954 RepID=UPI00146E315E|nr:hypothetical protein [Streptomyces sp. HNM0574]NLU69503.1 hypothetical protein [Streptomyces sp. HNM0574]